MKTTSTLAQVRPRDHQRYRDIPIFGRFLDDFVPWAFCRGYTLHTVYLQLDSVRHLSAWFQKNVRRSNWPLRAEDLAAAHRYFSGRRRDLRYAWGLRGFNTFLREHGHVGPEQAKALTRSESEVLRYIEHFRGSRGAADSTCYSVARGVRLFLEFIGFEDKKVLIRDLTLADVHRYFRSVAGKYARKTMVHVVGSVRGFLRFQFMAGFINRPLHLQIETVRIYHDEHLPQALPWTELTQLLHLIDRSTSLGLRHHTVILLAATYGLRASDIANLTLDSIDWRKRTIQIIQCKTRQPLALPLTDEVGSALVDYIVRGRPESLSRNVFLRCHAPIMPLSLPCVSNTLRRASNSVGIDLKAAGFRCLRHAVALRLLRQGTSLKGIGDILGHRSPSSTSIYLRLDVGDLRQIALPVPAAADPIDLVPTYSEPRCRPRPGARAAPKSWDWQSNLGSAMRDYLATQRALGRLYHPHECTLKGLDCFMACRFPAARLITKMIFSSWAKGLASLSPTTARARMLYVRKFCIHLERSHPGIYIPDLRTFPKELPHQAPYLFSPHEVARLLASTDQLRSKEKVPLHSAAIRIALLLAYCCGLRNSELRKLRLGDYDEDAKVLRIAETKFYKSRFVPVSASVACEIKCYFTARRMANMPSDATSPLLWTGYFGRNGAPLALSSAQFWAIFKKVCRQARVIDHRGRTPRLHDLRHGFAVEALRRGYRAGRHAQEVLPRLACYMGHTSSQFTHYYLKFTEPLRCVAGDLFRRYITPAIFPQSPARNGGSK